ncbi:unnamed protein product [Lymnaea stagnalis]|uniref:TIR domain-containing protein n=1 Tax=Lymnaea stagnalis TaxID=6523 RepID=A0AAV2I1C9_LYMST
MGNETSQTKQAVDRTQCPINCAPVPYIVPRTRGTSVTDSSSRSASPSFRCDDTSRRPPLKNEMVERGPGGCRTPPVTGGKFRNGVNNKPGQSQGLLHQQVYQGPQRTVEGRHCCLQEARQPAEVVNNIVSTAHSCDYSTVSVNEKQGDNTALLGGGRTAVRLKPKPSLVGPAEFGGQGSDIINTSGRDVLTNASHLCRLPRSSHPPHSLSNPSARLDSGDMPSHGTRSFQSNADNFNTGAFSELQTPECGSGLQSGLSTRTGKSFDTQSFSVNSGMVSSPSDSLDTRTGTSCEANQQAIFDEDSINSGAFSFPLDETRLGFIAESTHRSTWGVTNPQSDIPEDRYCVDYLSQSGGFLSTTSRYISGVMHTYETPSFGPTSGICPSFNGTMNSQYGEDTQSFLAAADSVDHVSQDDIFRDDNRGADQTVDVADGVDDSDGSHSISGYFSSSPGPSPMTSFSEMNEAKKPRIFGGQNPPPYFSHTFDSQGFYHTTVAFPPVSRDTSSYRPLSHVQSDEVTRLRVFPHVTCTTELPQEALPELFDSYNSIDAQGMSGSSGFISPVINPSSPDPCVQLNLSPGQLASFKSLDPDSNKENTAHDRHADRRTNQTGICTKPNQNIQPSLSSGSSSSSQEFLTSGDHRAGSKRGLSPIQNGCQGGNGRLCLADDSSEEELSSEEDDLRERGHVGGFSGAHKQQGSKDEKRSPGQQLQIQFPAAEPKKEKRIYYEEPANDMLSIFGSRETLERSEEDEDDVALTMDEIKPVRINANIHRYNRNNDMLSIFDGPNNIRQYYSAFFCCAEEDMESFGYSFHRMLENIGFKIFLPPRDLVLTGQLYENMARALEERCNGKIIVILSKNYADSEECLFMTYFARVLDPDARCKNIIPVQIDKTIGQLPSVLQGMSIIRYNQAFRLGWLKQKLIDAISA